MKIDTGREMALDLSEAPRFEPLSASFASAAASTVVDVGILAVGTLVMIALSFGWFLRYDVR